MAAAPRCLFDWEIKSTTATHSNRAEKQAEKKNGKRIRWKGDNNWNSRTKPFKCFRICAISQQCEHGSRSNAAATTQQQQRSSNNDCNCCRATITDSRWRQPQSNFNWLWSWMAKVCSQSSGRIKRPNCGVNSRKFGWKANLLWILKCAYIPFNYSFNYAANNSVF